MSTITLTARVRKDGSLGIPKLHRESLGLVVGGEVELTLSSAKSIRPLESNPLLELIGRAKDGPVDGSVRHDSYI